MCYVNVSVCICVSVYMGVRLSVRKLYECVSAYLHVYENVGVRMNVSVCICVFMYIG